MSESKRRFILPGVLIAAGLAGFGLAAASELDLDWGGTFQAGVVKVEADCQTTGPINVRFTNPTASSVPDAKTPWTVESIVFSGIADDCSTLAYQVAVKTTSSTTTWTELTNPQALPRVPGSEFSVKLGAHSPQNITDIALTIHGN